MKRGEGEKEERRGGSVSVRVGRRATVAIYTKALQLFCPLTHYTPDPYKHCTDYDYQSHLLRLCGARCGYARRCCVAAHASPTGDSPDLQGFRTRVTNHGHRGPKRLLYRIWRPCSKRRGAPRRDIITIEVGRMQCTFEPRICIHKEIERTGVHELSSLSSPHHQRRRGQRRSAHSAAWTGNSNTTSLPVRRLYTDEKESSLYSSEVASFESRNLQFPASVTSRCRWLYRRAATHTLISRLPSTPKRVRLPTISVGKTRSSRIFSWTEVRVRLYGRNVLFLGALRLGLGRVRRWATKTTWRSANFFSSSRVSLEMCGASALAQSAGRFKGLTSAVAF